MATASKIIVQVGDEVIELNGEEKEAFINQRVVDNEKFAKEEAEKVALENAKLSIIDKLGLSVEQAVLLGLLPESSNQDKA